MTLFRALTTAALLLVGLVPNLDAFNVGDLVKTDAAPHTSRATPDGNAPSIGTIPGSSTGTVVTPGTVPDVGRPGQTQTKVNWDVAGLADGFMSSPNLLLVSVITPPTGGLTQAELASFQQVVFAMVGGKAGDVGSLHEGIAAIGPILGQRTNGSTRGLLQSVFTKTMQAQTELGWALLDLMGAEVDPLGQPRSFYVSRAIGRINTVQNTLIPAIQQAALQAKNAGADLPSPNSMDRFVTVHVAGAKAKLQLFDRTLAYATPLPAPRPPGSFNAGAITIIGPHGDYPAMGKWASNVLSRLNLMYAAVLNGYGQDALLPGYNNKYQQVKFSSLLLQKWGVTMGSYAGLQFAGYPTDRFFQILTVLENLTHGGGGPTVPSNKCAPDFCHAMSYDFNNMSIWTRADMAVMVSGSTITRPNHFNQQIEVLNQAFEAWQAVDTGLVWFALEFPNCIKTGGCGGTGGGGN